MPIPVVLRLLRFLTRLIPPIPHASGLSNRLIKPLACWLSRPDKVLADTWSLHGRAIRLNVYPCDVVGGNLFFIPQLYDRWERRFIADHLPRNGVFVDVGGNIGAYALWAAACVGRRGKVIAFEAGRENYDLLCDNIQVNGCTGTVEAFRVGISDSEEVLSLGLNQTGNCGANSFRAVSARVEQVACLPLCEALRRAGADRVDMLKLDIEGFELRVLKRFFSDLAEFPTFVPEFLIVEIDGGPASADEKRELYDLIATNGYKCIQARENSLYRRADASEKRGSPTG